MTREQLAVLGISDENINQIMALHGQATQALRATLNNNETTIKTLKGELEEVKRTYEPPKPPIDPQLAEAQQQIAELRAEMNRKDISAYAVSKQLLGEQVDSVLKAFGNDVDLAKAAIDSISQIISDREKSAVANFEQQNMRNTGNPTGGATPPNDETPDDLRNAESLNFGVANNDAQSARNYYM